MTGLIPNRPDARIVLSNSETLRGIIVDDSKSQKSININRSQYVLHQPYCGVTKIFCTRRKKADALQNKSANIVEDCFEIDNFVLVHRAVNPVHSSHYK